MHNPALVFRHLLWNFILSPTVEQGHDQCANARGRPAGNAGDGIPYAYVFDIGSYPRARASAQRYLHSTRVPPTSHRGTPGIVSPISSS